jgi:hypothetical protein
MLELWNTFSSVIQNGALEALSFERLLQWLDYLASTFNSSNY